MQELIDSSLAALWRQRVDRARGVARLLSGIPFIRLVGLNGSLVTGRMSRESDIDFYIVTAPGRLYTGRLLATLATHLTGWRRYGDRVRGRVCLNRFATTEAMDITPHNDYHARVFSGLEPLWAADGVYESYQRANMWMAELGYEVAGSRRSMRRSAWRVAAQRMGEWLLDGWLGDRFERGQARWQRARIERDPRTVAAGSRVFIRENELCFHAIKE